MEIYAFSQVGYRMYIITEHTKPLDPCYWEFSDPHVQHASQWENHSGDGNRDSNFNRKLYKILDNSKAYILDIGCCHGEAVVDFIEDGYTAVCVDGYPLLPLTPTWKKYPKNFFQCDVGKPFELIENGQTVLFDCIMSWECFEHVKTEDIDCVIANINKHSKKNTLLILSIGKTIENVHRNLQPRGWWLEKLNKIGFVEKDMDFGGDLIRKLQNISEYFFMIKEDV